MLYLNEDIYEDKNIPYNVKGVWAAICATSERYENILVVPEFIKESKDFKSARLYLQWKGKIKGVTYQDNIILK